MDNHQSHLQVNALVLDLMNGHTISAY